MPTRSNSEAFRPRGRSFSSCLRAWTITRGKKCWWWTWSLRGGWWLNKIDEKTLYVLDINNHKQDNPKIAIPDERFCEWSQAAWDIQRDFLTNQDASDMWDLHFLGIYHDNDGHYMDQNSSLIAGRAMNQWWDKSEDAGPAARASEPFQVPQPSLECLTIHEGSLKPLCSHYTQNMSYD